MNQHYKALLQTSPILALLAFANVQAAEPRLTMAFQGSWDSAFSSKTGYKKGDVVSYNNVLYQSLISKNKLAPSSVDAVHWRKVLEAGAGSGGASTVGPDCEHPAAGANLVGCDFSAGTVLHNLDLRGAQLVNATLAGDLGVINLDGANLAGAKLGLEGVGDAQVGGLALTLQGGTGGGYAAKARGANLAGSQTPYGLPLQALAVDFSNANLTAINWSAANLVGAFMNQAVLVNAYLGECNASNANFSYADLRSASIYNAKLDNADFYEANLSRAQLYGSDLSGAKFVKANLSNAIVNASYAEPPSNLNGADFSGADLTGADLTGAINGDTVIYTSTTKFEATTCPDGVKVNGSTVTSCQGHGFGAPQ